ncbi:hypothetical protein E2C01_010620 [Portunus trituberculatus]|uniref:Uncharacterized protein n=1 Tax=Portunus trituberculatus TaxID=210409 RepID=A0A5B7D959_PORTR|nr:hypothetical protein [Portunus trituberculatus]
MPGSRGGRVWGRPPPRIVFLRPPPVEPSKLDDGQPGSILERVWQAFGDWANGSNKSQGQSSDCELQEVVAHQEVQKETHKTLKHKWAQETQATVQVFIHSMCEQKAGGR